VEKVRNVSRVELPFSRGAGERRGGVAGEFNAGINGFNAIEDGGGFKRGFK
jgi:hypothetical protein